MKSLSIFCLENMGVGKNSTSLKRVRLPTPAQLIRPDLEYKKRTNLPINHCAEMLAQTLRSEAGLSAQPQAILTQKAFYYIMLNNHLKTILKMFSSGCFFMIKEK